MLLWYKDENGKWQRETQPTRILALNFMQVLSLNIEESLLYSNRGLPFLTLIRYNISAYPFIEAQKQSYEKFFRSIIVTPLGVNAEGSDVYEILISLYDNTTIAFNASFNGGTNTFSYYTKKGEPSFVEKLWQN